MKRNYWVLGLFSLMFTVTGFAQRTTADIVREWVRAKEYTKSYLDAMPDSGYALKPTPEMKSFAEQMQHLTDANLRFVSAATGQKTPFSPSLEKTGDKSKAAVTKQVMDGYDFVIESVKKLPASQLNEHIKFYGKFDVSKEQLLDKAFEHQTHHRGQTTVYLRLAKVTPPGEKLF